MWYVSISKPVSVSKSIPGPRSTVYWVSWLAISDRWAWLFRRSNRRRIGRRICGKPPVLWLSANGLSPNGIPSDGLSANGLSGILLTTW
ncbi:hypothetical protein J1P26_04110 [Neobacillus sp. MM2021_6]|nr:hypothetical protein [Neobacillus sp. MM2021_6]NHC17635.1 hypothetical protein [Bacillus sp. MM2020_4]